MFRQVVHAAFGGRRKTLRRALAAAFPPPVVERALEAADLDGRRRGETLSVEEFGALAQALRRESPVSSGPGPSAAPDDPE